LSNIVLKRNFQSRKYTERGGGHGMRREETLNASKEEKGFFHFKITFNLDFIFY